MFFSPVMYRLVGVRLYNELCNGFFRTLGGMCEASDKADNESKLVTT